MIRRDRIAALAKAKAEGMNRRDRKALDRKLKADNLITRATEVVEAELDYLRKRKNNRWPGGLKFKEDLLRSDDWQAVGQRRQDLIEGLKRFNESETAAQSGRLRDMARRIKTHPYRDRAYSELTRI